MRSVSQNWIYVIFSWSRCSGTESSALSILREALFWRSWSCHAFRLIMARSWSNLAFYSFSLFSAYFCTLRSFFSHFNVWFISARSWNIFIFVFPSSIRNWIFRILLAIYFAFVCTRTRIWKLVNVFKTFICLSYRWTSIEVLRNIFGKILNLRKSTSAGPGVI